MLLITFLTLLATSHAQYSTTDPYSSSTYKNPNTTETYTTPPDYSYGSTDDGFDVGTFIWAFILGLCVFVMACMLLSCICKKCCDCFRRCCQSCCDCCGSFLFGSQYGEQQRQRREERGRQNGLQNSSDVELSELNQESQDSRLAAIMADEDDRQSDQNEMKPEKCSNSQIQPNQPSSLYPTPPVSQQSQQPPTTSATSTTGPISLPAPNNDSDDAYIDVEVVNLANDGTIVTNTTSIPKAHTPTPIKYNPVFYPNLDTQQTTYPYSNAPPAPLNNNQSPHTSDYPMNLGFSQNYFNPSTNSFEQQPIGFTNAYTPYTPFDGVDNTHYPIDPSYYRNQYHNNNKVNQNSDNITSSQPLPLYPNAATRPGLVGNPNEITSPLAVEQPPPAYSGPSIVSSNSTNPASTLTNDAPLHSSIPAAQAPTSFGPFSLSNKFLSQSDSTHLKHHDTDHMYLKNRDIDYKYDESDHYNENFDFSLTNPHKSSSTAPLLPNQQPSQPHAEESMLQPPSYSSQPSLSTIKMMETTQRSDKSTLPKYSDTKTFLESTKPCVTGDKNQPGQQSTQNTTTLTNDTPTNKPQLSERQPSVATAPIYDAVIYPNLCPDAPTKPPQRANEVKIGIKGGKKSGEHVNNDKQSDQNAHQPDQQPSQPNNNAAKNRNKKKQQQNTRDTTRPPRNLHELREQQQNESKKNQKRK